MQVSAETCEAAYAFRDAALRYIQQKTGCTDEEAQQAFARAMDRLGDAKISAPGDDE